MSTLPGNPSLTGSETSRSSKDINTPAISLRRTTLPRSTRAWSRGIVWSLIGLTSFAAVYGFTVKIESSISASGSIRPVGGDTEIRPAFNTFIKSLSVKEGDHVTSGQLLAQLRSEPYRLQLNQTKKIKDLVKKEHGNLALFLGISDPSSDNIAIDPLSFSSRIKELSLRKNASRDQLDRARIGVKQYVSDVKSLEERLRINRDILIRTTRLYEQGAVSQLELDRLLERFYELEATVNRAKLELDSARLRVHESEVKLEHIQAADSEEAVDQYNSVSQRLLELDAKQIELEDRIELSSIRSPVAGVVAKLSVNEGEFASVNSPLMTIVPQTKLNVDLKVANSDIGFLRVNQPVTIRVDSFPFTEYGSIKGVVKSISPDVMEPSSTSPTPFYPVSVELGSDHLVKNGGKHQLRPGMSVTSLISLGEKPLISLLIDRFSELFDAARTVH